MVPEEGLEPSPLAGRDFESRASAIPPLRLSSFQDSSPTVIAKGNSSDCCVSIIACPGFTIMLFFGLR